MIVVDASVALKWVLPEVDSAKAQALRRQDLVAPALWISEAANALWRLMRQGQITEAEALKHFQRLVSAPVRSAPIEPDASDALSLALALDHPAYDCFYLALAIRENTYVVAADNRFASAVRRHGKWTAHLKLLAET